MKGILKRSRVLGIFLFALLLSVGSATISLAAESDEMKNLWIEEEDAAEVLTVAEEDRDDFSDTFFTQSNKVIVCDEYTGITIDSSRSNIKQTWYDWENPEPNRAYPGSIIGVTMYGVKLSRTEGGDLMAETGAHSISSYNDFWGYFQLMIRPQFDQKISVGEAIYAYEEAYPEKRYDLYVMVLEYTLDSFEGFGISGEGLYQERVIFMPEGRNTVLKFEAQSNVVSGWKQDATGWWYQNSDGTYPRDCWEYIDGNWYYFEETGYMATGWIYEEGVWYYALSSGARATEWVKVGLTWYYFEPETGVMLENEWLDDTYYLSAGGAMATGWLWLDGTYYYMNTSGAKVTNGWVGSYYMDENGVMATDAWVDNGRYYVDASGAYVSTSGWFLLDGDYYYLSGGLKQTGWVLAGSVWYYMDPETGVMLANEWLNDTYYLDGSGAMATGWLWLDGTYYYMNTSGAKVTNQWIGNYYLQEDGTMATNTWIGNYYVGADGAWDATKTK